MEVPLFLLIIGYMSQSTGMFVFLSSISLVRFLLNLVIIKKEESNEI
jgi:hypothetical protein